MYYSITIERQFTPLDGTLAQLDQALNSLKHAVNELGPVLDADAPQVLLLLDGSLYYRQQIHIQAADWERVQPLVAKYFPQQGA